MRGMKKPIIFSVLFLIISSISSFGEGIWLEENLDPETGLRKGVIEVGGRIHHINRNAVLEGANLQGTNLQGADLPGANLKNANLSGANLIGSQA